jgi:hypothetical protein
MLLPILSLPTKEILREHTPPKPKRSKENDSSENSTQEMEKETVDEGHPDDDELVDEGQNSAAIGLRSILDGLWV